MPEKTVSTGAEKSQYKYLFTATTKGVDDYLADGFKGRPSKVNGLMLFDDVEGHVNSRMCNEFGNVTANWGSNEDPFKLSPKPFPIYIIVPPGGTPPPVAEFGWMSNMIKDIKLPASKEESGVVRDDANDWEIKALPHGGVDQVQLLTSEFTTAWNRMSGMPVREDNRFLPILTGSEPGVEIVIADTIRRRRWMQDVFALGADLRVTICAGKSPETLLAENGNLSTAWAQIKVWLEAKGYDPASANLAAGTINNKKGQPMKLTRAISAATPETVPDAFLSCVQSISGCTNKPTRDSYLALLSAAFKANDCVVLSANPADFITSTYGGGYTSCHAPGGAHFAGNTQFARAENVLMAFTGTPEEKIGRAWLWVDRDHKHMWLLKSYGIFPEQLRKIAREFVQHRLQPDTVWLRYKEKPFNTTSQADGGSQGYFDKQGADTAHAETVPYRDTLNAKDKIAVCLTCGKERPDNRSGCCSGHERIMVKPFHCDHCGTRLFKEEIAFEKDGLILCHGCIRTCQDCGEVTPRVYDVVGPRGARRSVCAACRSKYKPCAKCGGHYDPDYKTVTTFQGQDYCSSCLNEITTTCPACNETVLRSSMVAGTKKCTTCYSKNPQCSGCGSRRDKLNKDGLCPHCA